MLDLPAHASGDVRVVIAQALPHRGSGILHRLPVRFHAWQHTGQELRFQNRHCPDVGSRLQQRDSEVRSDGCNFVVRHELSRQVDAAVSGFRHAVDVLHQGSEILQRLRAVCLFHRALHGPRIVGPIVIVDALFEVEPFDRVQDRKAHAVELCHVRHVIREGVEDVPDHQRV